MFKSESCSLTISAAIHISCTRTSIHVSREMPRMRGPRARINRNRKAALAPLGTGSTNCLPACSLHLAMHTNASLHRIRLPPTGATTKRHTRWIAFTSDGVRVLVSQECTAESPRSPISRLDPILSCYFDIDV